MIATAGSQAGGAVSGEPGPETWIVTGDETVANETIVLDRELIIVPGGTLRLIHSALLVADGGGIHVAAGGTLVAEYTEFRRHNGADPVWPFLVFGVLDMENSSLAQSHGIELRYPDPSESRITGSRFIDNADQAVLVINRAELEFNDNVVTGSPKGIQVKDASARIEDNVFIGNSDYSIYVVSTLIGSRVFGPAMVHAENNVVAHGGGGFHFQEGNQLVTRVSSNLLTNLTVGLRFQEGDALGGQAELGKNAIVDNQAAALNFPRAGARAILSETLGYNVDLGDSWLGPDGATWEPDAGNHLYGPFDTTDLSDHDPAAHLWSRLAQAEQELG